MAQALLEQGETDLVVLFAHGDGGPGLLPPDGGRQGSGLELCPARTSTIQDLTPTLHSGEPSRAIRVSELAHRVPAYH
jgi:hypothetical protein